MTKLVSAASFADAKPHYDILDGLRGVAALMVLIYHLFEGFATSPSDQIWNHGYLAVPFFFILSGFVIGYAYDDRWNRMSIGEFCKRRLIRLHPMVIAGVVLGTISFLVQGSVKWDGSHVATSLVMLAMLCTMFMIPAAPGAGIEVRGNGELFPLNGPYWSLFMEYIGNILYALFIHRLPTKVLAVLTALMGVGLAWYSIGNGSGSYHLGVGWTMADGLHYAGMLLMLFCYTAGLLMSRVFRPVKIRGAFWICGLFVVVLTAMPYLQFGETAVANGIYDAVAVVVFFPILVWLGASGSVTDERSAWICKFLGDVSYPVYAIHYPSLYLFYAWVWNNHVPLEQALPVGVPILIANIILAYVLLHYYDMPVRKWLSKVFLKK